MRVLPSTSAALAVLGLAAVLSVAAPAVAQPAPLIGAPAAPANGAAAPSPLDELRAEIVRFTSHASEWRAKAQEYEHAQSDAPHQIALLDGEIAKLRAAGEAETPANATLDQLEVLAISAEQDLALAQRDASDLQTEVDSRTERRRQLPQLLGEAKARAAEPAAASPATDDDADVRAARDQLAQLHHDASESEVDAYEQELLSYEARGRVLDHQITLAQLRVAHEQARLDEIQRALGEKRKQAAARAAETALDSIQEAASLAPGVREVVRGLAEENAELARVRTGETGVLQAIDDVTRKLSNVDRRLGEVQTDFERLSKKVAGGQYSDSFGVLLRKTRSQMPDPGKYRRFIRMRQSSIAAVQSRQDDLRDQLAGLNDVDAAAKRLTTPFTGEMKQGDRVRVEVLVRDLLETKRRHLGALLRDNELYFQKLVDFDAREQELIGKTEQLLTFIDERILWTPSGGASPEKIARDALEGLRYAGQPGLWLRVARTLLAALLRAPIATFFVAAILVAAFWLRRPTARRLHELAARARAPTQTEIAPTLETLAISLAWALCGPAALAYLGWRISVSPDATLFVRCVARGMIAAAAVWLSLGVPRQIVRRDGAAIAHFGWPEAAVRSLRRQIGWVTSIVVPLVFVIELFEARGQDAWRESIGRIALVALLLAVTAFTHRVLREGGALRAIAREAEHVRIERWVWRLVYGAALAVPTALALSAARGYYWTALRLGQSYHLTLVFAFLLLSALHLALRWTLLARRRLAFEKWRAEHESERDAATDTGERYVLPEPEIDLGAVDVQTSRLLYTSAAVVTLLGLRVLWADLVPALGLLGDVELWNTTQTQVVSMTGADGVRQSHSEQRIVAITLANLLVALLLGFMTLALARNLPGLLEISLFRRWQPGPGERYAVASIAKYVVTLVGTVLAFGAVGIGWANVQWLVAAFGLGLGFGLQEIFANFVSGLIILFERPIRVGDTVTVGNVSGTVTRIRSRATWITAFDRKELIVPNKEFVTSQLVNWSLSDTMLRVDVPVGIAYGSDTEAALRTLLEVAEANENVMKDPKPRAVFLRFGESTLDMELRVFSPDVDRTLQIRHELHLAIDRAFREAGIEIAFPQRDVHIRSAPTVATAARDSAEDERGER